MMSFVEKRFSFQNITKSPFWQALNGVRENGIFKLFPAAERSESALTWIRAWNNEVLTFID